MVIFDNQIANSREEFLNLIPSDAAAVFFLVYRDKTPTEWESLLESSDENGKEYYFKFELNAHSPEGQSRFLATTEIERRAYEIRSDNRPLPYLGTFVPGVGFVQTAFKLSEINNAVNAARAQKQIISQIR